MAEAIPEPLPGPAHLTITRTTSYADRLRAYQIRLDGVVVGQVRAKESVTLPISPGRHWLTLQIDWCGSERLAFEAQPGEAIHFECGSNLSGARAFLATFFILFKTRDYLWLRRVS